MNEHDKWARHHLNRRDFLRYSLATGAVMWAGSQVPRGLIGEAEAQEVFGRADEDPPKVRFFPQSVASGDPAPGGIVLWTRVLPEPRDRDGSVKVGYRIALDDEEPDTDAFLSPLLSGVAQTNPGRDFTVKVQVQNEKLRPGTKYRYRFYIDGKRSKSGRFKTLPEPGANVASSRFGYISCQDYTNGYYTALYHLEREDELDFIVHLGDYIYETVAEGNFQGGGPEERQIDPARIGSATNGEADTLADYRFLYRKYKTDPNLQALHEKYAFITIWDDHEFANDGYRSFAPDSADNPRQADGTRRSAANRAWAEFTPAGVPYNADKGPLEEIKIYRTFDVGNLMTRVMTDERLYRDGPPCGFDTFDRVFTPGCGEEESEGRTMLGKTQKDYFLDKITNSNRRWKIWGNETMFMQFKTANTYLAGGEQEIFPGVQPPDGTGPGSTEGVYVNLDQWDGFQAERGEITQAILDANGGQGVENFVVITGDIHSYIAGYVRENYDDPTPPVPETGITGEDPNPNNRLVGTCFVCGSVTSSNLVELAAGAGNSDFPQVNERFLSSEEGLSLLQSAFQEPSNPHIEFFNSSTHGYNVMEVTQEKLTCTMFGVETTQQPPQGTQPEKSVLARFEVPSGLVNLQRTDIVPGPGTP